MWFNLRYITITYGPLSLNVVKCCRMSSNENIYRIKMTLKNLCILFEVGMYIHKLYNITFRRQIDIVTYKLLYFLSDTSLCLFVDDLMTVPC